VRIAPGFRCTGVASVASVPARRPATHLVYRHAEPVLLLGLAIPSAAIDWRIAQTWSWPAGLIALWLGATALAVGVALFRSQLRAIGSALAILSLYAVPVVGGIFRWHIVPSPGALIGDGAYQTQLAGDFLLRGIDPYGADYAAAGLGAAPWGETFASPALHHLVTWPGQFLWPLPLQLAARPLGWWDERIFLLVAAGLTWWLLSRLFPGVPGRLAATAFFLIPGHSLVAVLGDNDLPMLALVLAALLAADRRRYLLMGLLLGLAVVTKQHALLAVPLVAIWAVVRGADLPGLIRAAALATVAALATLAPFLLWDAGAFIRDTIVFVAGGGPDAYPINGFGFSAFLLSNGVIHGARDAFPFAVIEVVVGVAIWTIGWLRIRARARLADVLLFAGVAMLLVLYVSRYFHDSHLLLGGELIIAGLVTRVRPLAPPHAEVALAA
jgi:glycosyl transferase family 87